MRSSRRVSRFGLVAVVVGLLVASVAAPVAAAAPSGQAGQPANAGSACVKGHDRDCPSRPLLGGSFVQPDLADSWTPRQLTRELTLMRDAGLDTLVLQWTADSGTHTTIYPSHMPGYTQNTTHDVVERTLAAADRNHVSVQLGLNINDAWWTNSVHDRAWFLGEMGTANAIMDELWARYGHHRSLAGWFIVFEPWNEQLDAAATQTMIDGFKLVADHAHRRTHLPVMIAPFFNAFDGTGPAEFGAMWTSFLRGAPVDIIALQDGVGVGHTGVADLPAWFDAVRQAIRTSRPSTRLWSDTETFDVTDSSPMAVNGYLDDMIAVAPFVSKFLSFSFNHYISPQQVDPLYYRTYLLWVRHGQRDETSPSAPTRLAAAAAGPLAISLSWRAGRDDIGVAGYQIVRDGVPVGRIFGASTTSFVDDQLDPASTHTYTVAAFDAAGNASAASAPATATTATKPDYPTNLALGRSYTSTLDPDPGYPDTGATELTDGVHGAVDFFDPPWQGRLVNGSYAITVDLGAPSPIGEISTNWLQVLPAAVGLPTSLTYETSVDGVAWTTVKTLARPAVSTADQVKGYLVTGLVGVAGRFVRVTVTASNWSFIDELEVRN